MVSRKEGCPKTQKPCARLRDAERDDVAVGASGDPAMAFKSKMASILPMVRAFSPLSPSRRIAAGHAAWIFKIHALNTRAHARVNLRTQRRMLCFSSRAL